MNSYKQIGAFSVHTKRKQLFICIIFAIIAGIGIGGIFFTKIYESNTVAPYIFVLSCLALILIHEVIHIFFMTKFSKERYRAR